MSMETKDRTPDPQVTAREFRQVMGNFATGVVVVSTLDPAGRPYGLTVNSFASVSLQPLLILFCLENGLGGFEVFKRSGKFGISILSEDQEAISRHYASKTTDRSVHLRTKGITGVPLLEDALAILECEIVQLFPAGDHTIVLAEVKSVEQSADKTGKKPLLFFQGRYQRLLMERDCGRS